ncbi:MAG: hypothetical protein VKJ24_19310 [Synechococcales bacterium]|nr:hypothetical protein [Synechococcales bacterium]
MTEVSKAHINPDEAEMLDHYDFSHGIRGKYYKPDTSSQNPMVHLISETDDRQVEFQTIEVEVTIDQNGHLTAQLPGSIAAGQYRVVMMIEQSVESSENLSCS